MPKFTLIWKGTNYGTSEVEADTYEEAIDKGDDRQDENFQPCGSEEVKWEIHGVKNDKGEVVEERKW